MKYKILVVDDEPANTRMLERVLRDQFEVVSAGSGSEGLAVLNIHDVSLIISDQRMPGMSGVEFLKRSAEIRPNCVRIMLTGYTDAADLVEAINSSVVYKYVTKPWVGSELLQTVNRALSHYETIRAQHRLNLENTRLWERLRAAEDCLTKLCSEILTRHDNRLGERGPRVRDMAVMVGKALEMDSAAIDTLALAASLHGIAELHVPDNLRKRDTDLTEADKMTIDICQERGLNLLAGVPSLNDVVLTIRHMNESFDGEGWPDSLSGARIPIGSRIISVVRSFDKTVFPDDGSKGMSRDQAMEELRTEAGGKFDPNIIQVFCGLLAADDLKVVLSEPLTFAI